MRLIDADALKEKAVHYSETEYHFDHDAVQMDDIDDAPTIDASPWHRVEKPPREDGWYMLGFLSRWKNGNWWIPNFPDYWMPIEPPKEDA